MTTVGHTHTHACIYVYASDVYTCLHACIHAMAQLILQVTFFTNTIKNSSVYGLLKLSRICKRFSRVP